MNQSSPGRGSEFLFVQQGEAREGYVAEVAPLLPVKRTYAYAVPAGMEPILAPGQRVIVPTGRGGRPTPGFVIRIDRKPWDSTLRPITSLIDDQSFLNPELIELGRRISEHYVCPLGKTLKAITPEAVRQGRGLRRVRHVSQSPVAPFDSAAPRRLSAKRRAVIAALADAGTMEIKALSGQTGASLAVLRAMAADGLIEITESRALPSAPEPLATLIEPDFELNEEQRAALAEITNTLDAHRFAVTLLFGVSGSGKTEVYVRAIRRVVAEGRQAILLVPEIVLTTQLVTRLAARFSDTAVMHSGLSEVERSLVWRKIASGQRQVVIGTRSAVFAPCPNLGLICVDEEQETSYKNLQAPRFHVRDTAILRASLLKIPVILGSATPSLESWYNSTHRDDYHRVTIRQRVRSLPMPRIHIADMCAEWTEQKHAVIFSRPMIDGLRETLARGEQSVVLINRRGFAGRLVCPTCRTSVTCGRCNVGMVVHLPTREVICHYCHTRQPIPTHCANVTCGGKLVHMGVGSQRVEAELARIMPTARIQRVDSDIMRRREQYQSIVDRFERREIDVMVGTQMIAKGLDFPFVSFVGVVDADPAGMAGDFRADERLFQLITQVAGRAGRADAPGRVVVQTSMPGLPSLTHALTHDYESFAAGELAMRRTAGLPPYCRLARIVLAHQRDDTARREAERLTQTAADAITTLGIKHADAVGPNPCTISRLRGKYRQEILIRTLSAADMHRLFAHLGESKALTGGTATMIIDVDPVSMS